MLFCSAVSQFYVIMWTTVTASCWESFWQVFHLFCFLSFSFQTSDILFDGDEAGVQTKRTSDQKWVMGYQGSTMKLFSIQNGLWPVQLPYGLRMMCLLLWTEVNSEDSDDWTSCWWVFKIKTNLLIFTDWRKENWIQICQQNLQQRSKKCKSDWIFSFSLCWINKALFKTKINYYDVIFLDNIFSVVLLQTVEPKSEETK